MGKNCDFSKKRKCLMKTLKTLSEKLENSPPCHIKHYLSSACCPMGSYLPCGAPKCECILVQNSTPSPYSITKCGPFPENCSTILAPETCGPISSGHCVPSFASPYHHRRYQCNNEVGCCKPSKARCRDCCCRPQFYTRTCCCKLCISRCHCAPLCKIGNRCCTPSGCQKQHYRQRIFEYTPKKKYIKCPVGNLCCNCNTICIPRCCSDTTLVSRKMGKSLSCSKSVELRGGKLYRGCNCDKRDGLQDSCARYCCINNPECRTVPASCHCSKYSCGKHLRIRFGRNRSISYTCYICGPPTYQCMPCRPMIPFCECRCCCKNKCDTGCQSCPTKCEQTETENVNKQNKQTECYYQSGSEPCPPPPMSSLVCAEPSSPCPQLCSLFSKPCSISPELCCLLPLPSSKLSERTDGTCAPCIEAMTSPFENRSVCIGGTQTMADNCSCYLEYCPPQCLSCQTHQY